VTEDVSHADKSLAKFDEKANMDLMSVTDDVSHANTLLAKLEERRHM
jgi:hypothetical protein